MGLQDRLIQINSSAKSRTNILDIDGDLTLIIEQLLQPNHEKLFVTYNSRKFKQEKKETKAKFEIRIHREIKDFIWNELSSIEAKTHIEYETIRHWEDNGLKVYFFYLSSQQNSPDDLLKDIVNESIDKHKIVEGLIGLHFKLSFIHQACEFYEFKPSYFNSELYLSVTPQGKINKNGVVWLDALYPKIYFSETNELIFTLHKKTFKAQKIDGITTQLNDTQLLFRNKQAAFGVTDKVSATKQSKKKFMTFGKGYHQCINFSQNLAADTLIGLLNQFGINYNERCFQANYVLDDFIEAEKLPCNDLIVIDNLGESVTESQRQLLYDELKNSLKPLKFVGSEKYSSLNLLEKNKNYLVLNYSLIKNGSSIQNMTTGEVLNNFWTAYRQTKKENFQNFDYYTRLKIARFDTQGSSVIQGLDVDDLSKKSRYKQTEEYYFVSPFKIQKIISELWLKERVFQYKRLEDIALPDCKLTLVYIRKILGKKDNFFASVVDMVVKDKILIIKSHQILKTEKRLQHYFPLLKNRTLYNESFYMLDKERDVMLSSYNSSIIPQIIGNQQVDNIEFSERNGGKIRRLSAADVSPLPYYLLEIERKQYHHIYLQQRESNLLFFVSSQQRPNQNIDKQNLIYNVLTFNKSGELLDAITQDVTNIYLESFTQDILRVNEVSKSSLLEKVAKLFVEN